MTPIMKHLAVLTVGLLLCGAAGASKQATHQTVAFDPGAFADQRTRIERDINGSERYAEIGNKGRRDVLDRLAAIDNILDGVTSIDQLDQAERADLFSYQEEVNSILTKAADDSRIVCKRQAKTGSHRMETRCRTVAQLRLERDASQKVMRDVMRAKLPEIERGPTYNRGGGVN
jgi:hypothetical protein